MTRTVRLRPWQKAALDRFLAAESADFLTVATPGAGKTTFALAAARHQLASTPSRLIVVAPTAHLKTQWARAAAGLSLHLDPSWSTADGALSADMHGIVTSYQQVAASADALARLARGAFVILDEIHHAADERAWGAAVLHAFAGAGRRLSLSGTPFRSDTRAIPFVNYQHDEAVPDYEYGYGDALADGRVVRPVYFPRTNGQMEWAAPDGSLHAASFDDPLDVARSGQRLRTALSLDGDWLVSVLRAANDRLVETRSEQPDAGGLVIAMDQEHARGIASVLRTRFGMPTRVATSDDPGASKVIDGFARGQEPWLVAVRMVSEGVDIPRLRVGVYATTTSTELFFRQAVGRFVRWTPGVPRQRSWLFIPDDARLRRLASTIVEQRRHSLRRPDSEAALEPELDEEPRQQPDDEQLSLFAAISAVVTDAAEPDDHELWRELDALDERPGNEIEILLAPPPALRSDGTGAAEEGLTRREVKQRLRDANAEVARELSRRTGLTHAQVNGELNRRTGIQRIAQATLGQLERRLRMADRWMTTAR
jgi:superfamily II DNA or RNA helicase